MPKFINLKQLTACSFIAILAAASLIAQPVTATPGNGNGNGNSSSNSSCDDGNNGHGNSAPIPITLSTGKTITITQFDPSNPGNGDFITRRINAADSSLTTAEISEATTKLRQLITNCSSGNTSISNALTVTVAAPVKIDSLDTTRVTATPRTDNVCDSNGNNCAAKNYGTGNNIKLNGFRAGGKDYSILKLVDEARFKRVNNNNVQGVRHIYFLEKGSNDSIKSSAVFKMEDAVRSDFINGGTDNVFANDGGVNVNNIERVDFLINSGLIVKQEYVNDAGFLILERGNRNEHDPFKIAAITEIDADGNPSKFGNLISISSSNWGDSDIQIETNVLQKQPDWNAPRLTAGVGKQYIGGTFISIASLGVISGQTIYGYALFPNDTPQNSSSSNLVSLTQFSYKHLWRFRQRWVRLNL